MKISNFPTDNAYTGIHFFNESGAALPLDLTDAKSIAGYIEDGEQCHFHLIEIAFIDEQEIVRINQEHLERNYLTDIISFRYDQDESNAAIEGTLYCCAPRIAEQSEEHGEPAAREFRRIIIHGLLHLVGYEDQSDATGKEMRERENFYLQKL
jgi:rRNA maturation RNase YbeY